MGEPAESARPESASPRKTPLRRLGRLALVGAGAYLLLVLFMLVVENALIYFPSVYPDGVWNPPGLEFEDAWFEAPDGTRLHGWFVPHANPRAVVLVAHGNGGNLSHRYELLRSLHRLGVAAMIFD